MAMLNAKHVGTRQSSRLLYRPVYKEVFSLKMDKVEMTPIEFEKYMDEHIVSDCCSIRLPFSEI